MQTLRRLESLFNSRDLDAYTRLLDPAIEWHVAREDPDSTVHRGRDQVRAYLEGWIEAFADLQIHMKVTGDEGDRVLTELRFHGHGTESGVPFEQLVGFAYSLRAGCVTKVDDLGRTDSGLGSNPSGPMS